MDFEKLHSQIYKWQNYTQVSRHGPRGHWVVRRQLSQKEWDTIGELLDEEGSSFFCQMTNTEFGFQLAMAIYADAHFPGVPADCVFVVRPSILPGHDEDRDRGPEHWDKMWQLFSRYTHSEHNARILKFYNMEPPQDKVHYAY